MNYKEHYRIDAIEFDYWGADQISPVETRRNQTVFELCQIIAGDKVLDIGSGRGWFSLYAASLGADVTALDLSAENLLKIKEQNSSITTVLGDACEIPIEGEKFDWIVALEVLEHIVEPKTAIQQWKNLLKPTGKILLSVPNKEIIRYSLCIHCNQKTPHNAHLHSFDKDALIKLFNRQDCWVKSTHLFSHRVMTVLPITNLVRKLPYRFWRFWDKACRIFGDKYSYLAIIATQKQK